MMGARVSSFFYLHDLVRLALNTGAQRNALHSDDLAADDEQEESLFSRGLVLLGDNDGIHIEDHLLRCSPLGVVEDPKVALSGWEMLRDEQLDHPGDVAGLPLGIGVRRRDGGEAEAQQSCESEVAQEPHRIDLLAKGTKGQTAWIRT